MTLLSLLSIAGEVPPVDPYFPALNGDVTFTDEHFNFSIPGYAKTGNTGRSPAGYVEFKTLLTDFSVKVGGDWSGQSNNESCVFLLVKMGFVWVYDQKITLTADNTTETHAITTLSGGEKEIRLVNGYAAVGYTNPLPTYCVTVQGIVTSGDVEIKRPQTVTDKFLVLGDSISTGASADYPTIDGWDTLLRSDGFDLQLDTYGARVMPTNQGEVDAIVPHIDSQMNGTVSNTLFIALGTNNFGIDGESKATFKSGYGKFLDTLHVLRSDINIVCVSPIGRMDQATPNGSGAVLQDFRDAITELLATRAWAKYIDGAPLITVAIGNFVDGNVHPNTPTHQQYHDNFLTAYNAL